MTSALNSLTAFCGNILLGFTQILELLEETRHFGRKMMICIVLLSLARRKILISWWIVEQAALTYEIFNIKKGKIFNTKAVWPSQQNPTSKRFTRSRRSSEMWAQTEETVSFNDSMTIYESASSVAVTFKHFRQFWEKRSIILRNFQKLVSFLVTCRITLFNSSRYIRALQQAGSNNFQTSKMAASLPPPYQDVVPPEEEGIFRNALPATQVELHVSCRWVN